MIPNLDLLTLLDEHELEFGKTFLRDDQVPNLDPDNLPYGYWMGLEHGYEEYEEWKWVDGWPLTRSNWAAGHQNITIGHCAFINKDQARTFTMLPKVHLGDLHI